MKHEAWFFIGLFAFIFIVWIAIGGPSRGFNISAPTLSLSTGEASSSGGGSYFSLPSAPFTIGGSYITLPGSSSGGSVSGSASFPGNVNRSSYQGTVTMTYNVNGAGSSNPGAEWLELSVSSGAQYPVDLTGWSLRSTATGRSALFPRGTKVARTGVVNDIEDITLNPGEGAIINSGPSPIGVSFEENECTGYLAEYQSFTPKLAINCPSGYADVSNNITSHALDDGCINDLEDLTSCEIPSPSSGASNACQHAMSTYLNYNGCVALHQSDNDFPGTTWRIYLWQAAPLFEPDHDTVELLDSHGRLVDAFTY